MKNEKLNYLENELQSAFYWMAKATQETRVGEFSGAVYSMTVAVQRFATCQHYADLFLNGNCDEKTFAEISASALKKAQEEIAEELAEEK